MRLITNLNYVTVLRPGANGHGVRTSCAAVLLTPSEERMPMFGDVAPATIRGFGMDPAWPVFDIFLPDGIGIDYESQAWQSANLIVSDATPAGRPISSGDVLRFGDGTSLALDVEDHERPITYDDWPGGDGEGSDWDSEGFWRLLTYRVRSFHTPPFMPLLHFMPSEQVRGLTPEPQRPRQPEGT